MSMMIDETIEAVLAAYEDRAENEARIIGSLGESDFYMQRDDFLLSVGRRTATLLNVIASEAGARTILEIGTSYGYSTIWLAAAARETGGRVVTLELQQEKSDYARQQLARAGLEPFVEFRVGDARESIAALPGPFDFVLLDLWKDLYIPCFDLVLPKLATGAVVVADNMLHPPQSRPHADAYHAHVHRTPGLESVLLAVGSGIEITRKL
jgi:predicted O-methyltransferase YrrM